MLETRLRIFNGLGEPVRLFQSKQSSLMQTGFRNKVEVLDRGEVPYLTIPEDGEKLEVKTQEYYNLPILKEVCVSPLPSGYDVYLVPPEYARAYRGGDKTLLIVGEPVYSWEAWEEGEVCGYLNLYVA
jgi:hypothetical protein